MKQFVCFESEDGNERYRFEIDNQSTWAEIIGETFQQKTVSQTMLKKIIEESNDVVLVESALSYFKGKLSYDFLNNLREKFLKEGEDICYGVVVYCTINKKKAFLKKFSKSENEDLCKAASNALYDI